MDDAPPHSLEARDTMSDPTYAAEHTERQERLAVALAKLPESQRRAIQLTFYEGLSHSDAAERLGEPLGTIKTRIRLAMTKLRTALSSEFGGLGDDDLLARRAVRAGCRLCARRDDR